MSIKVYAVNDCDWVAGDFETPRAAAHWYVSEVLCGREPTAADIEDYAEEPYQLSDEQMESHMIRRDEDVDSEEIPFAQMLQEMITRGDRFPCVFASTEY